MSGPYDPWQHPVTLGQLPVASFERVFDEQSAKTAYVFAVDAPRYYEAWLGVPATKLQQLVPPGERQAEVLSVSARAVLLQDDINNVKTLGFMGAALQYSSPNPPALAIYDLGQTRSGWPYAAVEESIEYDSTSLTISGTDQPIWTRLFTDSISLNVRSNLADKFGGNQTLWFTMLFQIHATAASADAATILTRLTWGPPI